MRKDNTSEETVPALLTELLALMWHTGRRFGGNSHIDERWHWFSVRCLRLPATR